MRRVVKYRHSLSLQPLVHLFWQELLLIESRPAPFCSALGSFMLGSAPWRAPVWQLHRACVLVCWKLTRCPLSVSSSVNRSWAVNTSPADGNDVKPTSHLISPLPALSSLTPCIPSLINLFFLLSSSFFALFTLLYLHLPLAPDLFHHTFDFLSSFPSLPLSFLPFSLSVHM